MMERIGNNLEKAILTLENMKENLGQKNQQIEVIKQKKPHLDWLPEKYKSLYESTDLLYSFCVKIFSMIETNMRENIPETTMRSWFVEFIKAGWTSKMVSKRYEAIIRNTKYGTIDFSSWVNAVPVYGEDEVNNMVANKIKAMIERGKKLIKDKDNIISITPEDREAIELALLKEIEFEILNEKLRKIDKYKDLRREELKKSIKHKEEKEKEDL